jgi:adenylate cyclase
VKLNILQSRKRAIETARAAVLFADLRGYTRLAEHLPAERVVSLLEEFFEVLSASVEKHGGAVFFLAGDGLMAGFGGGDAEVASSVMAAGHEMLERFAPIAERWNQELGVDTGIGIGIHMGDVAIGRLGPPGRKAPTLVGDTVNVAARLCSRARAGEVVFSSTIATALAASGITTANDDPPYLHLPHVTLRGRTEPLDIWCVPAAMRMPV